LEASHKQNQTGRGGTFGREKQEVLPEDECFGARGGSKPPTQRDCPASSFLDSHPDWLGL
jgi:hypothetical protein